MIYTIENKIYSRMKKAKRGLVFFTGDFTSFGNNKAEYDIICKNQKRLC